MTGTMAGATVDELDRVDPKTYYRRWLILATMCLSLVLIVASVSSVNVAIPSLSGSELRPSDTQVLWIVDSYALVFAALLPPAGALGDRFGRKGALLIGLVIFAVASAVSAFMTSVRTPANTARLRTDRTGAYTAGALEFRFLRT